MSGARCRISTVFKHFLGTKECKQKLFQSRSIHSLVTKNERLNCEAIQSRCRGIASTTGTTRHIESLKQRVSGVDIHYERTGKGDHPVLLLPGALGCTRTDFEPQLQGLSTAKYTIIAMDPRGCGKSRPPDRDWPIDFLKRDAEDAAALMKALSFPRYSILGWSDGANTSMILAAANPGNVVSQVIWGGNSYISEEDFKLYKIIENTDDWSPRMKKSFIDVYGEDYFKELWAGWIKVQSEIFHKRNGDICVGSLPNINCPTLLVNGVKDAMVPQEQPLFLHKHIINCRMVTWPEGKHNLHLRYAPEFNALAEEFLDEVWSLQA